MIGMLDHCRTLLMTSTPCVSGRPRSRISRSGRSLAAISKPLAALAASRTRYSCVSSMTRRNRRSGTSSSMTKTVCLGIGLNSSGGHHLESAGDGKRKLEHRPAAGTIAGADGSAVCVDDAAADGQPQAGAAIGLIGLQAGAEKFFEDALLRAGGQAGA